MGPGWGLGFIYLRASVFRPGLCFFMVWASSLGFRVQCLGRFSVCRLRDSWAGLERKELGVGALGVVWMKSELS